MFNYKLAIGQKELIIRLTTKRGRPKRTLLLLIQKFAAYLKKVYQDNRFQGNKISRVLRRILETKKIKKAVGLNLMLAIFLISTVDKSIPTINLQASVKPVVYAVNEVKITTDRAINRPLDNLFINQGYHLFHPAIDLKATKGTPVYALKSGEVEKIILAKFGYGHHLIIKQEADLKILYAHLDKINVQENQAVNQNTILGTVGTTGWSTGPHLHLEIWQNGKSINPSTILQF